MTPGARVSAAIEILDAMQAGLAAEQALTRWARASRFAGSKDRAAVRDHVFDVLRQRRPAAHWGNGDTGRALMIGVLRLQGAELDAPFSGDGHAPDPLTQAEQVCPVAPADPAISWDLPDWLVPYFKASLGERAETVARALQSRAPISLRINTAKVDISAAIKNLSQNGVETQRNELCDTALTVTSGERKIRNSVSYLEGEVELQDAASQAVVAAIPKAGRVLDFCAGGGGKALALATEPGVQVFAHDIDPRRMTDLPVRAARAGVTITQIDTESCTRQAPFDVVLCDAPCSGSGAWRRSPEGKLTLTQGRLDDLTLVQDSILDQAAKLTAPDGVLAYATCSVLTCENEDRVNAFLKRNSDWEMTFQRRYDVDSNGDGFFTSHLMRA